MRRTAADDSASLLRSRLEALRTAQSLTVAGIADLAGLGPKAIMAFLNGTGQPRASTLRQIAAALPQLERPSGYFTRSMYLSLASGMGAEIDNHRFLRAFAGDYAVFRTHMPTRRLLVSRLRIFADPEDEGAVVRFRHAHAVADAHPGRLDDGLQASSPIVYEGIVLNCDRRAFLLSTGREVGVLKEIILSMPRVVAAEHSAPVGSIFGLLLTVSADDRTPFAARLVVHSLRGLDADRLRDYESGLRPLEAWSQPMYATLADEIGPRAGYGMLSLRAGHVVTE
jgi:transcriptional regulator with XRE-family HTH domain